MAVREFVAARPCHCINLDLEGLVHPYSRRSDYVLDPGRMEIPSAIDTSTGVATDAGVGAVHPDGRTGETRRHTRRSETTTWRR